MPAAAPLPESLLPSEEDLLYEEEILRNPFSLKLWWRYLRARRESPVKKRYLIYERALHALPGSYKLWHAYLQERIAAVRGLCITHSSYGALNNTFERALVTMHKMPRIWLLYLQILMDQKLITHTRRCFDRVLCSLPATQHDRVWELYLKFVKQEEVPVETALRVYRRYLKMEPTQVEEYIDFLMQSNMWQEASEKLAQILNDEEFTSVKGKTKHQLWLELCDLLTKHATEVKGLKVDAIIKGGLRKFSDEVGRLWTSLADFYIRRGLFENARDVYEDGMNSVVTVRDFSMIFDAYTQFEESMLAAKIEMLEQEERKKEERRKVMLRSKALNGHDNNSKHSNEIDKEDNYDWLHDSDDLDLRIARLDLLLERRPELVSSVLLRQNPHNVHEWHKRAKLFESNPAKQILTYTEAVKTVDPQKAVGKVYTLWVKFARLYEEHGDLPNARVILEKAVQAEHKGVDDLSALWCEWAEMELRAKNFSGARELMKRATAEPSMAVRRQAATEGDERVQLRVYRNLKLWSFYVDLEESLGTLETTKSCYERILDLKIATPQIIINYALLLEENSYYEDAFKVYERGVHIFKYPHVKDIWTAYLTKFVQRYGGKKMERARDLFEQALEQAPSEESKPLYLQYAKLEEEYGLAKHAMAIYDRATKAVPNTEKLGVFEIYIARAAEFFGISRTREIYDRAIESGLPDSDVKMMCLKYAALERKLGEIDRARGIYTYAAQLADPRSDSVFWETWNAFEIAHGNEDTFREMLRLKRSVSASYSQMHFILPEYLMQKAAQPGQAPITEGEKEGGEVSGKPGGGLEEDSMAALERNSLPPPPNATQRVPIFVSAGREEQKSGQVVVANPEEIELNEDEGEGEEGEGEEGGEGGKGERGDDMELAQRSVPDAVYGALADKAREIEEREREEPMGAMERIKRQRRQ